MTTTILGMMLAASLAAAGRDDSAPLPWGFLGHEMAARAAAQALPPGMPAFFLAAADQLTYLDPEPDRWRSREDREMDQAFSYDHYVDLENLPDGALEAPDRFAYLRELYAAGLEKPERDGGFLPFRIVELYQRLESGFRRWRAATGDERRWVEARIINDAGILGHYVTDAANPHHTTIHFNGWSSSAPNPEGYTTDRSFHSRFERYFVDAHVRAEDVQARVTGSPTAVADVRAAVLSYIRESHGLVEELYRLDRDVGFDPEAPATAEARDFAAARLAAGASMLRTLWWSAWVNSGDG